MGKKANRGKDKDKLKQIKQVENAAANALINSPPPPQGLLADQLIGSPEPQVAPKTPERIKVADKKQGDNRNAALGGRIDTAQMRSKASAQQRKLQGHRTGNR
jgi:hypothetical protein